MMRRPRLGLGLLLGGVMAAGSAGASGYKVNEQSAEALGSAMAGATASGESAADLFFNPAASGFMESPRISAVAAGIFPSFDFEGAATTAAGTPVAGRRSADGKVDSLVPALYGAMPLAGNWSGGLAISAPWGLATEYPSNWVGRYHALDSELLTVNVTPSLAWQPRPELSIGFGLQAQYARAELSNAIDFGSLGAGFGVPGAQPGLQDGRARLDGDDWGYGYVLGVQFRPTPATQLGLSYRSRIEHELGGDVHFRLDSAGVGAALRGASGAFRSGGARADLTTPETIGLAVRQQLSPEWVVMAGATHTRWSRFDELRLRFDNPAQPDSVTVEDWDDSTLYSLGASYSPSAVWTWRAGVAFDESPVPDRTRTPRVPDSDRYWLSLGMSYRPMPRLGLHAAYLHVWVEDADIALATADPGNAQRGGLSGQYDSHADVLAAQLDWRF